MLYELSACYEHAKDYPPALRYAERSLGVLSALDQGDAAVINSLAECSEVHGMLLQHQGRETEATASLESAVDIYKRAGRPDGVIQCLNLLVFQYVKAHNLTKAQQTLQRAEALCATTPADGRRAEHKKSILRTIRRCYVSC